MRKAIYLFTRYEDNGDNLREFLDIWKVCSLDLKMIYEFQVIHDHGTSDDKLYVIPFYRIREDIQRTHPDIENYYPNAIIYNKILHYLKDYLTEDYHNLILLHMKGKNSGTFEHLSQQFKQKWINVDIAEYSTVKNGSKNWYNEHIVPLASEAIYDQYPYFLPHNPFDKLWNYFYLLKVDNFLKYCRDSRDTSSILDDSSFGFILNIKISREETVRDYVQKHLDLNEKGNNFRFNLSRLRALLCN